MTVTELQFERLQQRVRSLEERLASVFLPDGTVVLSSSQKVRIVVGASRITLEERGITIEATEVNVRATRIEMDSTAMTFNSPMVSMSNTVRCNVIIAGSVISSSYTPGAGNVM